MYINTLSCCSNMLLIWRSLCPHTVGYCRLIATLGAGDALGEMALLKQGGLRTATVQATTDCEVLLDCTESIVHVSDHHVSWMWNCNSHRAGKSVWYVV